MESDSQTRIAEEARSNSASADSWIQPSIGTLHPASHAERVLDGLYAVVLERLGFVNAEQAWFWSGDWQSGEKKVDAHIQAGEVEEFDSIEEFLASMKK